MMNPLAQELNDQLVQHSPHVLEMLSDLGKNLFFPKGILTQSAEAKEKAHKYNATIGIATENGGPMFLQCIQDKLSAFDPKDIYPYAPPAGKPELRALWREKMLRENPSQNGKHFSNPSVTNALTHGLSIVGDMFVDKGDHLILPDMLWGNYNLTFGTCNGAIVKKHPTFTVTGGLSAIIHLRQVLEVGLGTTMLPDQIIVGSAHEAFDVDGGLSEERSAVHLEKVLIRLVEEAARFAD
jgi:hypothetical protein